MIPPSISDRIAERLDDPIDIALNGRPYIEALRGVLREHRSRPVKNPWGPDWLVCSTCHRNGSPAKWPCPTVAEIATCLGVEGGPR